MLEEEADINNENMCLINKLIKRNKILTERNNKYEYELKNDYKNKMQQYKEYIEILELVFENQYKNTLNANNNELFPPNKTIELLTHLGNLLHPKTIDYNYKPLSQQLDGNDNQMTFVCNECS